MEYTGEEQLCKHCKHQAANPKSKRPTWEYGKIRSKEREQEREDKREREKERKVPRKKAA
jgi:hypothetical protein